MGEIPVEVHTCAGLAERHDCVTVDDHPHQPEHSIEVQLSFLQRVLADGWTCGRWSARICPTTSIRRARNDAIGIRRKQL